MRVGSITAVSVIMGFVGMGSGVSVNRSSTVAVGSGTGVSLISISGVAVGSGIGVSLNSIVLGLSMVGIRPLV